MKIIFSILFFIVILISLFVCILVGRSQIFTDFQEKTFEMLNYVDEDTTNNKVKLINDTIMLVVQILFGISQVDELKKFIEDQSRKNTRS